MGNANIEGNDITIGRREAMKRLGLLLGVAVTSNGFSAALARRSGTAVSGAGPRYLTAAQFEAVSSISERIIPRTDSIGAVDAGVPEFIDLSYGEYLSEPEKAVFVGGLVDLDLRARNADATKFALLGEQGRDALLRELADSPQSRQGGSFWRLIRELTLLGYFTSEAVGKEVLNFDPIPGQFDPCIPMGAIGNVSWTID